MASFVQDIGGGNKLVWDLNDPDDAQTLATMFMVFMVLFFIAAIGFGLYYLFFK